MNLSHIEHLGIAVKSIEASLPYYEGILGLKCYNIEEVADQKVKTAFFKIAVPNTDEALQELADKGVQLIDKQSRKGAEGLNIGFLHPKSTIGVLTELCDHRDVK